jgi:hypothetical protein
MLLGASAAGILLAGCGGGSSTSTSSSLVPPPESADIALLNALLALEQHSAAAYTAVIPLLSGRTQKAAKQFLSQDLEHVGRLSSLIKKAGGKPVEPLASYNLGRPRTTQQLLALLHSIEGAVVAEYLRAIPMVPQSKARAYLATILANEAQHVSVLRSKLHLDPVPSALVTGRE